MTDGPTSQHEVAEVAALVLTHRRPRLATEVVRGLIEFERIPPHNIFLVVNGEGGLLDPELERSVQVVKLAENIGPAGGYRAGLLHIAAVTSVPWVYICEDDIGLFELPAPRIGRVIEAVGQLPRSDRVGAVVAYGRHLDRRTGLASVHKVTNASPRFETVDVAAWGATLLSRSVLDAGVIPDASWFFGFEDFDFWLHVQKVGFAVLVDNESARVTSGRGVGFSREESFADERPNDAEEPWRAYYLARNFLELRRRWGTPRWTFWHLVKSARRLQLAPDGAHRRALVVGLRDGFLRRLGKNSEFQRVEGEF